MKSGHRSPDLADLARASERKRDAALLRATTELFVLDTEHDSDEIRRYEQLALHFLPRVPSADRLFVAERLAMCNDAPHAVVTMLARDVVDVAAPVIRHSRVIEPIDLISVIAATDVAHQRLIAQRRPMFPDVARALRLTGDAGVLAHLDDGASMLAILEGQAGGPIAEQTRSECASMRAIDLDPWRFLGLDRRARVNAIATVASRPLGIDDGRGGSLPDLAFRSILGAARIVGFARSGQLPAIVTAISEGLDLAPDLVAAGVNDPGGEVLAVMLKALRLDDVQARQVFLLASASGRDTGLFFPLADLYSGMEPAVAEALVATWRDAAAGQRRHEPHLAPNGERRHPAATEFDSRSRPDEQAQRA